jgi:hypothetical protein
MYNLSVGAIFKNEQHILKEWLDHYIFHGVEHFYLINDGSTDSSIDILKPYIDKELVTLFYSDLPNTLGRQHCAYNKYILPRIKETKWLLMIDLDEFVWSEDSVNLRDVLSRCSHLAQIQIHDHVFGSNGHVKQPISVVQGFTRRTAKDRDSRGVLKYCVNSSYEFTGLNIHSATHADQKEADTLFLLLGRPHFRINHYCCQSKEFWDHVKCKRGDADNYRVRTPADFKEVDVNEVDDFGLAEQNRAISPR